MRRYNSYTDRNPYSLPWVLCVSWLFFGKLKTEVEEENDRKGPPTPPSPAPESIWRFLPADVLSCFSNPTEISLAFQNEFPPSGVKPWGWHPEQYPTERWLKTPRSWHSPSDLRRSLRGTNWSSSNHRFLGKRGPVFSAVGRRREPEQSDFERIVEREENFSWNAAVEGSIAEVRGDTWTSGDNDDASGRQYMRASIRDSDVNITSI